MPERYSNLNHYEIRAKLSKGKYNDVYEGVNSYTSYPIIMKILKPIRRPKIAREIKILQLLQKVTNKKN